MYIQWTEYIYVPDDCQLKILEPIYLRSQLGMLILIPTYEKKLRTMKHKHLSSIRSHINIICPFTFKISKNISNLSLYQNSKGWKCQVKDKKNSMRLQIHSQL